MRDNEAEGEIQRLQKAVDTLQADNADKAATIAALRAEVAELTERNDSGWALARERLHQINRLKGTE